MLVIPKSQKVVIPKSQKEWITSDHYALRFNGDQKYLKTAGKYPGKMRFEHRINTEILFLDDVQLGLDERKVVKKLGDPFFIYRNDLEKNQHCVYSYGLKSGSKKLKVEIHFLNKLFAFGTIRFFKSAVNYSELNAQIKLKYGLPDFHYLRDIIVDPLGNVLEFHVENDYLVIMIFHRNQIQAWNYKTR